MKAKVKRNENGKVREINVYVPDYNPQTKLERMVYDEGANREDVYDICKNIVNQYGENPTMKQVIVEVYDYYNN